MSDTDFDLLKSALELKLASMIARPEKRADIVRGGDVREATRRG